MGTRMVPPYENLFMGALEAKALNTAPDKPLFWLLDIFSIWTHEQDKLTEFMNTLNNIHPTIKFKSYISPTSTHFLDVTFTLNNNNNLSTNLYVQPTDTHQYLLPSSAHPKHDKHSIPYSLAIRLRRICSNNTTFTSRTKNYLQT